MTSLSYGVATLKFEKFHFNLKSPLPPSNVFYPNAFNLFFQRRRIKEERNSVERCPLLNFVFLPVVVPVKFIVFAFSYMRYMYCTVHTNTNTNKIYLLYFHLRYSSFTFHQRWAALFFLGVRFR